MEGMNWVTETDVKASPWKIDHGSHVWTVGSCFADNLGARMADRLLDVRVNPLGTFFNPASIATALEAVLDGREYRPEEMVKSGEKYHCMDYASTFSDFTANDAARNVNAALCELRSELKRLDVLIVTFGSTHVFEYKPTGQIAGNCHKLPQSEFSERDLGIDEITGRWSELIKRLRQENGDLQVLFTVSPVRHKAYGLHCDRLSKSRLLLAVEQLCGSEGNTYFPAYEILTDELRDYRWYASDMIHPSEAACDYIFEKWCEAYCTPQTRGIFAECLKFTNMLKHRVEENPQMRMRHTEAIREMEMRLIARYDGLQAATRRAVSKSVYNTD